jgi:hypothetical protein
MAPVAARLGELLGTEVPLAPGVVGPKAEPYVASLEPGQVLMLENLRFDPGETADDSGCKRHLRAEQLAQPRRDRRHRVLRIGRSVRSPEVTGHDEGGALVPEPFERGQRSGDTQVVGDRAVLQGDVEVDAHKNASPAREREVLETRDPEVSARQGTR